MFQLLKADGRRLLTIENWTYQIGRDYIYVYKYGTSFLWIYMVWITWIELTTFIIRRRWRQQQGSWNPVYKGIHHRSGIGALPRPRPFFRQYAHNQPVNGLLQCETKKSRFYKWIFNISSTIILHDNIL